MPDRVHVLAAGRIVKSGDHQLARELDARGYDWIQAEAARSMKAEALQRELDTRGTDLPGSGDDAPPPPRRARRSDRGRATDAAPRDLALYGLEEARARLLRRAAEPARPAHHRGRGRAARRRAAPGSGACLVFVDGHAVGELGSGAAVPGLELGDPRTHWGASSAAPHDSTSRAPSLELEHGVRADRASGCDSRRASARRTSSTSCSSPAAAGARAAAAHQHRARTRGAADGRRAPHRRGRAERLDQRRHGDRSRGGIPAHALSPPAARPRARAHVAAHGGPCGRRRPLARLRGPRRAPDPQ